MQAQLNDYSTCVTGFPPQLKKTNPILSGSFSFRGLCAAMPCRLRREPLRAGAAFMRVNSLTSLLRKRCLLRTPLISTTTEKTNPITVGFFFCFISGTGVIVEREREGKTLKRCCPLGKTIAIVRCCFCLSLYATQYATVYFPIPSVLFD